MPVYIAIPTTDKKSEHPILVERGVAQRTTGPLNRINIYGMVTELETAYAAYVTNISSFLSATAFQKKIKVNANPSGHPEDLGIFGWSPTQPKVSFVTRKRLTDAQQVQLKERFQEEGLEFFKSGEFQKATITRPHNEVISALWPLASQVPRNDSSEIPIGAWDSTSLLVYIVNMFLSVNTYPAFKSIDEREEVRPVQLLEVSRIPYDFSNVTDEAPGSAILPTGLESDEDEEMEDDAELTISWDRMSEAVFTAKPSPIPSSANVGPPAEVPNLPGLFFPYFHRLIQPDYTTIPKIVGTLFYRFLGSTTKEADQAFKDIQKCWGSLMNTDLGLILSHVFKGIQLALQTQTRLFIIQVQNDYLGFCLLGARFRVYDGDTFVEPLGPEELRSDIFQHASSHLAALGEIFLMLQRNEDRTVPCPEDVSQVLGPHHLMRMIGARKWTEDEEAAMQRLLGKLNFRVAFWTITNTTLIQAIRLLSVDAGTPITDDKYPGYAGKDVNLYGERAYRVLSMFGPTAFSFINKAGTAYSFPPMSEDDPLTKETNGDPAPLSAIHVGIKPLAQAVADWKEVVQQGVIRVNLGERAGKYRNCVFTKKSKIEIWDALRQFVRPIVPVVAAPVHSKGKKRAVDEEFDLDGFLDKVTKRRG